MFTNTLAERITRDLKWEEDEYLDDDGYDGEEEEESIELIHLQNQVFQALIDSIYDALVLYNSFLVKLEEVAARFQEEIHELNDRVCSLSTIYIRCLTGDLLDSASDVGFLMHRLLSVK
jgi:hypothetical protein